MYRSVYKKLLFFGLYFCYFCMGLYGFGEIVKTKRLIYIRDIINEQPYKIVSFKNELQRDAEKVLWHIIKYTADTNLREVLRLLKRADPRKTKKIEELEKALDKIVLITLNF